jgi:hypothetical protein
MNFTVALGSMAATAGVEDELVQAASAAILQVRSSLTELKRRRGGSKLLLLHVVVLALLRTGGDDWQ